MKTKLIETLLRARVAWFILPALFFMLSTARPASAQYTTAGAYTSWTSYNTYFLFRDSGSPQGKYFAEHQGNTNNPESGFWEEAEEIEDADDAYYFAVNNGYSSSDQAAIVTEINSLCQGFVNEHTASWGTSDRFNDDLDWAIIAFIRAYQITNAAGSPNTQWLTDAENNFTTVYGRAQTGNGGLAQAQPPSPVPSGWEPNLDAPVNFTFVIAGYLIYGNGGGTAYKTDADGVYTWAMANLYTTSSNNGGPCTGYSSLTCGKIRDSNPGGPYTIAPWSSYSNTASSIGPDDYTYNYGIAIQAATREGGATNFTEAQNIANYLMYNLNNTTAPVDGMAYDGTYEGYNILPNYGQDGVNNAGYNGIALRGVGFGYSRGSLSATTLAFAQANVNAAWLNKNSNSVVWNDWKAGATTPASGGLYSWDCSAALAGLLDIPAP